MEVYGRSHLGGQSGRIASYACTLLIGYALGRHFSPNGKAGGLERHLEAAQESARAAEVPDTYDGEDLLYCTRM